MSNKYNDLKVTYFILGLAAFGFLLCFIVL